MTVIVGVKEEGKRRRRTHEVSRSARGFKVV